MKNKTSLVTFLQLICLGTALAQTPSIPLGPAVVPYRFDGVSARPDILRRSFNTPVAPLNGMSGSFLNTSLYNSPLALPLWSPIDFYSTSRFQTFDVNNIGNINCILQTDQILNGLDEVQGITAVDECFEKKRSWERPRDGEKLSERQLLESDQAVCACLRSKKKFESLQAILNTQTPNLPNFSTANAFGNFERNLHIVKDKITSRHEMISLQASLIFNGNVKFASEYSEGLSTLNGTDDFKKVTHEMNIGRNQAQIKADERTELSVKIRAELDKFTSAHQPNMNLYTEKKFAAPPVQCISFREFISYRTLPRFKTSKDVFDKKFDAGDWDYKALRHSYKTYMAFSPEKKKQNKDKILELKNKILFLDSNPMIKNVIAASRNLPDYLGDTSIPQETRDAAKAKFNKSNLETIETKLFAIMKDYNQKKDNAGEYREKLKDFYADDDIKQLSEMMTSVEDKRDRAPLVSEEAFLPPNMFKPENLTQKALEEEFMRSTGLSNPDDCTDRGADIVKCAETYAGYCRTIDTAVDTIRQMDHEPSVVNDLDSQLENLLNPDIATNKSFRDFNESVCNTPRKSSSGNHELTFFQFKDEYCSKNSAAAECSLGSPGDYEKIRKAYNNEYPRHANRNNGHDPDEVDDFNDTVDKAPVTFIAKEDAAGIFTPGNNQNFTTMRPDRSNSGAGALASSADGKAVPFSGVARGLGSLASAMGGSSEGSVADEGQNNYSINNLNGSQSSQTTEVPKIENMPQTEREALLDDWKKEMADWKANKNSPDGSQSGTSANEESMKAKIEALEQLLAQQKKLTEDQYKLLNDSIAAQTRSAERSLASVEEENSPKARKKSGNGIIGSNVDLSDETQRGPGNIPDTQLNTSGSAGGSSAAASSRARSSGSSAISDSSRDSVAREEAKLVNLRENSNGSITITSSNNGATSASANAIVVPVSDAFYLSAKSNPNGLNLSQIQQSIPADQIARLQDKGDFFILLLQNGTNPPLEVKVKKENNKLVQVEGAPVVSRRVSLDSLRNTLK